jgi:hypothetical protein
VTNLEYGLHSRSWKAFQVRRKLQEVTKCVLEALTSQGSGTQMPSIVDSSSRNLVVSYWECDQNDVRPKYPGIGFDPRGPRANLWPELTNKGL